MRDGIICWGSSTANNKVSTVHKKTVGLKAFAKKTDSRREFSNLTYFPLTDWKHHASGNTALTVLNNQCNLPSWFWTISKPQKIQFILYNQWLKIMFMRAVSSFSIGEDRMPHSDCKNHAIEMCNSKIKKEISFFTFLVSPAWANSVSKVTWSNIPHRDLVTGRLS